MPLDPAVQVGPIPLHWYGLGYAIAFLVGVRVITPFLERRGIPPKTTSELVWWNIGMGLLGARLYFDIQQPDLSVFVREPIRIIAVWEGGMAFFGALIACVMTCIVFTYVKKLPLWAVIDAGALFATLPQAIGRIGNVINGDILGPPSNLPWAVRYTNPASMAPHLGVAYTPANLYEAIGVLLILGVLLYLRRRGVPSGVLGLTYLVLYPVSQLILFQWRTDFETPVIAFGLKQAQLTSVVMLLTIVPIFFVLWLRSRRKGEAGATPEAMIPA